MYKYLDKINYPEDLKNLTYKELRFLAKDIRRFLVNSVSKTGGHLASNLGVVELTLAMLKVYEPPKDKIIFDVGHQSYVYKILTGRKEQFHTLRQLGGLSGFPKINESVYDCFNTGHSSTSISAAIGMAIARDMKKEDFQVVSLIGDSSISNGLSFEALNFLGSSNLDVLIILNDNNMSIERNVGALNNHLNKLRLNKNYRKLSRNVKETLLNIPMVGEKSVKVIKGVKDKIKEITIESNIFKDFGIDYFGIVDGHNIKDIVDALNEMKKIKGPKILHISTVKGKGYRFSQNDPTTYHGVSKFDKKQPIPSSKKETFSKVAGSTLDKIFKEDKKAVAISAAMIKGTGLYKLKEKYKDRVIDVGMEEENAVTIAAGMAKENIKPYVCIYSTFLQRAYDEILHDVCLQNFPVTFLIDRAGVVGEDGETHNGMYDMAYLSHMPNMEIYSPKDKIEMEKIILATKDKKCPVAIRYERGTVYNLGFDKNDENILNWEEIETIGNSTIIATGKMVGLAMDTIKLLKDKYNINIKLINARRIKPVDKLAMDKILKDEYIFIMQDSINLGGLFLMVSDYISRKKENPKLINFSFPDKPIEHGNTCEIYSKYGFTKEKLAQKICNIIK